MLPAFYFERSHRLKKRGIPVSTLRLVPGDASPGTAAAGSAGVMDSDSSCPIVMDGSRCREQVQPYAFF